MDIDCLLSKKVQDINPSKIRKFFDLAAEVEDVISLSVGEPDFFTPWVIRNEAIKTIESRRQVYSANAGMLALRKEISKYTERKIGVKYNPKTDIVVTVGGSEAIDIAIRAIIDDGDEVIIPEPSFVCYAPIVKLAGGVPVIIETTVEEKFKLTPSSFEKAITPKTKLLILPYPNNPTGAIMTKEDLEPIADILRKHNIAVVSDEIYSELTYSAQHFSITQFEDIKERTILINGFSKSFAMTGWRLGYLCANEKFVQQILKIHQYAIMCSPTVSQYAAITALKNCDEEVQKMKEEYNVRRRYCVAEFNRLGLECFTPEGAFYVFPSIKSTGMSSDEFCEKLLHEKKVAVIPGNAFGDSGDGYIRVSYAYSLKHLSDAIKKIGEFLNHS
ncbi:aminotransferase [Clostridia bacterium]|nr:aminotransferase [Clostridia bacterium]